MWVQYRATTKRVERTRVGYLALGGFVATTLALTDVLPRFGVAWPAVGNVLGILYLYFLSQTLFRYRLIDLNELVGKMAVLGTLVVLLSAVYGLLLYWVGSGQQGLYLLNALVAAFVILILFEPVRSWLENGINRWLLRQRTELRGRLDGRAPRAARRRRRRRHGRADHHRARGVAPRDRRRGLPARSRRRRVRPRGLLRQGRRRSGSTPTPNARCSTAYVPATSISSRSRPRARRRSASTGPPTSRAKRTALVALRSRAEEIHAALIFPLFGSAETEQGPWLLGLFCVRDDRTDSAFDPDDIDTFRQLAIGRRARDRVVAGVRAGQGARPPRRARRDGRRPRPRDPQPARRDQGRGAAPGPPGRHADRARPRDRRVPRASSSRRSNRLNNVVTRFLDYARAERPGPRAPTRSISTTSCARPCSCSSRSRDKGIEFARPHRRARCRTVAGDPESLLQVFLNLGQNALQAMPDGGTLEILTTRRRRSRLGYGQFCEVRFRDTGVGIPRDQPQEAVHPVLHDQAEGHRARPRDLASASSTSTAARSRSARRSARARRSRCSCRPPSRCRRTRSRTSPRPAG